MEGIPVDYLFQKYPEVAEQFENPTSPFWSHLQRWHDNLALASTGRVPPPGRGSSAAANSRTQAEALL